MAGAVGDLRSSKKLPYVELRAVAIRFALHSKRREQSEPVKKKLTSTKLNSLAILSLDVAGNVHKE